MKNLYCLFSLCPLFALAGCSYTTVEPGKVGIRVNFYGSNKGVEDAPLVTGRVWYNPFTEQVYEYPTFIQQATWTKDINEGSPADESITFNSQEGSVVNVDVGLAYAFKQEKVPHIFVKLRQEPEVITHGYMRNKVRDCFNEHASTMKITDIFGGQKHALIEKVKADLQAELEPEGFIIDGVSFLSAFRVDPLVEQSINQSIQASQRSIEAQNKVAQVKAEAEQAVAKAQGMADSVLLEAKAKAEANRILSESLTPELVQYEALQKWDGKLPHVSGSGAVPFISVPAGK